MRTRLPLPRGWKLRVKSSILHAGIIGEADWNQKMGIWNGPCDPQPAPQGS